MRHNGDHRVRHHGQPATQARRLDAHGEARHAGQAGALCVWLGAEDRGRGRQNIAARRHLAGELLVRGQWIVDGYYKDEKSTFVNGWFPTGDIATIDEHGIMQIRDRSKDVIKSGGKWISSINQKSAAMGHSAVAMSAVYVEKVEILEYLETQVAHWWLPDDIIFLKSIPLGGTGKVIKGDLRKHYHGAFNL